MSEAKRWEREGDGGSGREWEWEWVGASIREERLDTVGKSVEKVVFYLFFPVCGGGERRGEGEREGISLVRGFSGTAEVEGWAWAREEDERG